MRQILDIKAIHTVAPTHVYEVTFTGYFTDYELINAVDNGCYKLNPTDEDLECCNFGGVVTPVGYTIDGDIKAIVKVYVD